MFLGSELKYAVNHPATSLFESGHVPAPPGFTTARAKTAISTKGLALQAAAAEFNIQIADTTELLHDAYRLRHQVYCVEKGFEDGGASCMEIDEFDDHAPHIVVRRKTDGEVVGAARLVLPQRHRIDNGMPIGRLCGPELAWRVPLATSGEVSRFAVSKERRGLSNEATSLLRLALVQGMVRLSAQHGITHWCAVMERSLLRLLRSTAIHFDAVGPVVEYHGIRQPAVASIDAVLTRMKAEQPEIWDFVTLGGSLWDDGGADQPYEHLQQREPAIPALVYA